VIAPLTLLAAAASMAMKDVLATLLTIAEAHDRPVVAGLLDIAMDVAQVICMAIGVGEVIVHKLSWASVEVLAAMSVGSFIATFFGVRLGHRLMPDQRPLPAAR
jgi:hypothetical protein